MSIADLFRSVSNGAQNAVQGFSQGLQPPADPNAINPQYGVSEGDVQAAKMANLQRMSAMLIAAGQSMPGSDRAQILSQMGNNDVSKQLYTMAQARLMNTQAQDALTQRQRQQQAMQALQSPDFQAQIGNQLGDREKAIFGAYLTAGDSAGALDYLKQNDALRARFGGGMMGGGLGGATDENGNPVTGDAFLNNVTPEAAGVIKGIANYELDPTKVASAKGDQRMRLLAAVKQYDPTFDMSQFPARQAMRKSVTSGQYSQSINAANLVVQHLDAVQQAADALNNSDIPLVNTVRNKYLEQTGDPRIKAFQTAADAAGAELAKVFKGVGSTSLQEIDAWRHNLDPNASPAQIKAAIQMATTQLLASRLDTIKTQYQSVMGKPADFTILTPHSRQILARDGVDPDALDVGSGSGAATGGLQPGTVDGGYRYKGGDPSNPASWEKVK